MIERRKQNTQTLTNAAAHLIFDSYYYVAITSRIGSVSIIAAAHAAHGDMQKASVAHFSLQSTSAANQSHCGLFQTGIIISPNAAFNHTARPNLHLRLQPCLIVPAGDKAAAQSGALTSFRGFMGRVKMVCQ